MRIYRNRVRLAIFVVGESHEVLCGSSNMNLEHSDEFKIVDKS